MATQQYGYGINAWGGATPLGAVKIPTLNQPGGAAPQFKKQNPFAASAAKMVGEMAYGAMQEQMAPEYVGFNERLGKDVFRIKEGSSQFAPENGWGSTMGENGILERDLKSALADLRVQEQEKLVDFNTQLSQGFGSRPTEYSNLQRPITEEQAMQFEGFKPSMVPNNTNKNNIINQKESEKFVPADPTGVEKYFGEGDELKAYITRLNSAMQPVLERYQNEKGKALQPKTWDINKKQSELLSHRDDADFLTWAMQAGSSINLKTKAGGHFYKDGKIDYNLLAQYESNPFQYWLTNIKGKE